MKNSIKIQIPTTKAIGNISDWDMGDEVIIRDGDKVERFKVLGIKGNKLILKRLDNHCVNIGESGGKSDL